MLGRAWVTFFLLVGRAWVSAKNFLGSDWGRAWVQTFFSEKHFFIYALFLQLIHKVQQIHKNNILYLIKYFL